MAIGETFKRQVEVELPKTKRGEQLEKMHEQYRELREIEAEKRREMAEKNQELKDARAACDSLSAALASGKFIQEVQCKEVLVGKEVHTVRVDTGAVVEKRAATSDELQVTTEDVLAAKRGNGKGGKPKGRKARAEA